MTSKPRKALPKIKVPVPIASGLLLSPTLQTLVDSLSCFDRVNYEFCSAASGTSIYQDDKDEEMEGAVTSHASKTLCHFVII